MAYIGNQPTDNFVTFATQNFTTSATSSYTLSHAVSNENEIALFINNVRQHPGSGKAYTASGTALTLSANTASTDVMYCIFLGRAIQSTVPATNSITAAMVGNDLVSGKDALTVSPAATDEILLSDAGTLKRTDVSVFGNAPAFKVTLSGNQTIADDTLTRVTWDTEEYDTNSAFASNIFTVPSGEGGKYVFEFHVFGDDIDDADVWSTYLELDGTEVAGSIGEKRGVSGTNNCPMNNTVTVTCTAGQTIEVVTKHQGTSASQEIRSNNSFFSGYKLIGV